jgi:ribonuclease BN (tRNA processing enzyme)
MVIEILGVRGELETQLPNYEKHCGVLVDDQLLLDFGETSFLEKHPKWVLITHLHPDHAAFLNTSLTKDLPIVISPEASMLTSLQIENQPFTLSNYHLTPVPTIHTPKTKSQGYRIDDGQHSIFYSGDMTNIEERYRSLLVHLDLVITDGSYIQPNALAAGENAGQADGHTDIPKLLELFAPYTKKIVFIHFGEWFFKDLEGSLTKLQQLGKEKGIEVIAGYEGLKIELN